MPLLNDLDKVYVGNEAMDAIYIGADKVWPSGFDPRSISGLAVWFDAGQIGLANGADVNPWPNLGSGTNAGMVGTPLPTFKTNGANGLPVVRFKANEGRLRMTGLPFDDNWTVAYVARMVGPTYGRILNGIYTPNNILIGWWNGQEDVFYDNGFSAPNTQTPWTPNWRMYSADGTPGFDRVFRNGVQLGTIATAQGFGGTLAISGYAAGTDASESCDCEVAEVLIYERTLPDADRQKVEQYLQKKYAIGGYPPWTPADINGLGLWLEADKITGVTDGGPVTTWIDASAEARHAVARSTTPKWKATGLGGKPSVEFSNSPTSVLVVPGWGTALSGKTEYTMFQVITSNEFASYPVITSAPTYTTWAWLSEYDPSGQVYWGQPGGRYNLYAAGTAAGVPSLLTYSLETLGGPRFYKNGTQITTFTPNGGGIGQPVPSLGADALIGGYFNDTLGITGQVAAIIWYDRFLVDSERNRVESYLRTKYGI